MPNLSPPFPEQIPLFPEAPVDPEQIRHRELDRLCKLVLDLDRGRVLSLLCTAEFCRIAGLPTVAPVLLDQLDKEFPSIKRVGDYLLRVRFALREVLMHFEFQKRPDGEMGLRLHGYQGAMVTRYRLPVVSIVLVVQSGQGVALRVDSYELGPMSTTGWVNLALEPLVATWPARTDSPMAEMLRALVVGQLDPQYLRSLLVILRELGLGDEDCRSVLMMLSFLLSIRRGGDGHECQDIVDEVFAMLQLEDSWIYQRGAVQGKHSGIAESILQVLTDRGIPCPPAVQARIMGCTDSSILRKWLSRALFVSSADVLFGET